MKQRLINVLKWFFITLGVLFLIQILIALGIAIGFSNLANAKPPVIDNTSNKLKDMKNAINYIEEYYSKNNSYPENIDEVKFRKGIEYKYELSKDKNCYTITTKSKKDALTKQYQRCSIKSQNTSSNSESFIEYSN